MFATARTRKTTFDIRSLMGSFAIGFIMLYLVFHALNGNHGVYALFKEQSRATSNSEILIGLTEQRQKLEHRVNMISSETLDLDLLDEQARRVLGYTNPSEIIYMLPEESE